MLNPKSFSPKQNRFREIYKNRMEQLGFNYASDNDQQHGLYNSIIQPGLSLIALNEKQAKPEQIRMDELADACIVVARPDWREKLENPVPSFICPRCRKERVFLEDKKRSVIICLARRCGRAFPINEAMKHMKFKPRRLNLDYVNAISQILQAKTAARSQPVAVVQSQGGGRGPVDAGPTPPRDTCEDPKDV
jgi:hypothetical protein